MFEQGLRGGNKFCLHLYCENCMRANTRYLVIAAADDAPRDVEEFIESAVMDQLHYSCNFCQEPITQLVAVTMPEAAAA